MVPLKPCQPVGGHIARAVRLSAVARYYHRDKEWGLEAETSAVTVEGARGREVDEDTVWLQWIMSFGKKKKNYRLAEMWVSGRASGALAVSLRVQRAALASDSVTRWQAGGVSYCFQQIEQINKCYWSPTCCLWLTEKLIDFLLFLDWNIKTTSFMLSRNRTSSNPLGRRGRRVGWLDKCACYLCFPINIVNKWMNSSSTILDCCWERWWLLLAETSLHLLEALVRFDRTGTNVVHCSPRRWSWSLSCSWTWNSWMALRRAPNGDLNIGKHDGKDWC